MKNCVLSMFRSFCFVGLTELNDRIFCLFLLHSADPTARRNLLFVPANDP